jgi:hypothetical protein
MATVSLHLRDDEKIELLSAKNHSAPLDGSWVSLIFGGDELCIHFRSPNQLAQLADAVGVACRELNGGQEWEPTDTVAVVAAGKEAENVQ